MLKTYNVSVFLRVSSLIGRRYHRNSTQINVPVEIKENSFTLLYDWVLDILNFFMLKKNVHIYKHSVNQENFLFVQNKM